MVDVSVIIPTYFEADNLSELVRRVSDALVPNYSFEIIVVDDNSTDNTSHICQQLALDYPLRLITRFDERGLSSAVVRGMNESEARYLVCMDADLSHPPESLVQLVNPVANGTSQFVVGSRYVTGGSTEEGWGAFRWLNSKVASLMARPLTGLHDPMSGFFCLPKPLFERAEDLRPVGYKICLELLVKCRVSNVTEIPIRFAVRYHGESKLSLKEQFNYLRHLWRLYVFKTKSLTLKRIDL